jgi:hypothetical protein
MPTLQVTVGKKLFEFSTFGNWGDTASCKFAKVGVTDQQVICLDIKGRICTCGHEFMRARDEGTFPVRVYAAVITPEEEAADAKSPRDAQTDSESLAERGDDAVSLVFAELRKAEEKHPGWPDDQIHAVAILAEEAGEAMKAAIDHHYAGGSIEHLRLELAQTGAMALRALLHLPPSKGGR